MKSRRDARFMQTMAEYDPAPPFGNIDWSQVNQADAQQLRWNHAETFYATSHPVRGSQ
jgi:hypothetical protein